MTIGMVYAFYESYKNSTFSLEKTFKNSLKEDESLVCPHNINETLGITNIRYDCDDSIRKKCNGEYSILANRIGDKWIIDESSKKILV